MEEQTNKREAVLVSIFKSHAHRLGFVRASVGGWFLYTTIPLFLFLHTTITTVTYSLILQPLLGLPRKKYGTYIILDRYNLKALSPFDRFNCLFCEYASGVTMLLNAEIDTIAKARFKHRGVFVGFLLYFFIVIESLVLGFLIFITAFPTYIFMRALKYHRTSSTKVLQALIQNEYAKNHHVPIRYLIYMHKLIATILMYNLSQIESQWCPIKHLKKANMITPNYQSLFVEREEILLLKDILEQKGTVAKETIHKGNSLLDDIL